MNHEYVESLNVLRQAFGTVSETPILARLIQDHVADRNKVTMLDVGIGAGISANKVVSQLWQNGIRVSLTGIDPYIPSSAYAQNWPSVPRLIRARLAEHHPGIRYDVVNATQSLYYLGDEAEAVARLVSLLSPGGILTITMWAHGCVLKRIHDNCLALGSSSPSPEALVRFLRSALPRRYMVSTHLFKGAIALRSGSEVSAALVGAIINIARRDAEISPGGADLVREYLGSQGSSVPRYNAIIVAAPSESYR